MVVCYFNVMGVSAFPAKADSPPIVDPDTVLPLAIALQGLEPVARRDFQVLKALGLVKVQELSPCNPFYRAKPRHVQVIEECLGFGITERPDHRL
jgi:hypothetical protein